MKIPNFLNAKFVDKTGELTPDWKQILMQLFSELQNKVSEEGFYIPEQITTDITKLQSTASIGALIYDKTTNELKVNINGTFKVIQVV